MKRRAVLRRRIARVGHCSRVAGRASVSLRCKLRHVHWWAWDRNHVRACDHNLVVEITRVEAAAAAAAEHEGHEAESLQDLR